MLYASNYVGQSTSILCTSLPFYCRHSAVMFKLTSVMKLFARLNNFISCEIWSIECLKIVARCFRRARSNIIIENYLCCSHRLLQTCPLYVYIHSFQWTIVIIKCPVIIWPHLYRENRAHVLFKYNGHRIMGVSIHDLCHLRDGTNCILSSTVRRLFIVCLFPFRCPSLQLRSLFSFFTCLFLNSFLKRYWCILLSFQEHTFLSSVLHLFRIL